jgi:hypothetical protein
VAAQKPSQPLHAVFLERVIKIAAVQRHRAAVTDEYAEKFFDAGSRLAGLDDFYWSVDAPELLSNRGKVQLLGVIGPRSFTFPEEAISPAMQAAWNAAFTAWQTLISALRNGELVATARHPASGKRRELHPAEWSRAGLILDVHNGDLFEKQHGHRELVERWLSITLRLAEARPKPKPGVWDKDDWWKHEVGRRKRAELPLQRVYIRQAVPMIMELYGVKEDAISPSELRRMKAALYRGDDDRPKHGRGEAETR